MNKNKLYILLIFGLLASNLMLLGYLLTTKTHEKSLPRKREIIIEKLNFDKEQIVQYDELIHLHKKEILDQETTMKELKQQLYSNLKNIENKSKTDSLAIEIGKIQTEIEHIHYTHFEGIKKICHGSQMDDYNELINELAQLFSSFTSIKKYNR